MKRLIAALLASIVLVCALALTGCDNGENFTEQTYSSDKDIRAIIIDTQDREITVRASDDHQIHMNYFESEKEYYDISISGNNTLTVRLATKKNWTDFIGIKPSLSYRKLEIKIPPALLSNLEITTTNEQITLYPLTVTDSITLSSNGGNIIFEKTLIGKSLTVTAKNGNITGTILGNYDIFSIVCEIKKGNCNLPLKKEGGEKSFQANCNNGDIEVDFVKE